MHGLMIFLIGVASSIDNFAVGMSYGIKGKKITRAANLFMAAIAWITSMATLLAGSLIGFTLPEFFARLISGTMILSIGLWSLISAATHRKAMLNTFPQAEQIDRDRNDLISFNETFWLGFALSFNAMGTSFGAGIGGLNPVGVALTVAVLSFLSIDAGQQLGLKKLRSRMGLLSEFIASLLLILIGICTLFTSM